MVNWQLYIAQLTSVVSGKFRPKWRLVYSLIRMGFGRAGFHNIQTGPLIGQKLWAGPGFYEKLEILALPTFLY